MSIDESVAQSAPATPEHEVPAGLLMLLAPSANRVYAGDAARLNAAELQVLASGLGRQIQVEATEVAGVDYLLVEDSTETDVRLASEASGAWALFAADGSALRPRALQRRRLYPDDVVTIQKYQGKTNEQFTHLLMNVTAALSTRASGLLDGSLTFLDPMCGRGTTLNSALIRGFDVVGADVDKSDLEQYQAFITTWLRNHRFKHAVDTMQVKRSGKVFGRQLDVEVAPTKELWKAGETQRVTYFGVDTTRLDAVMRKASVDVVVADTPYGVQHGSHGESVRRSPLDLLARALPAWHTVLRTGGTVGLAYNRHVAAPDALAELLDDHGFEVVHGHGAPAAGLDEDAFRHRVDASIDRDVVVARKA